MMGKFFLLLFSLPPIVPSPVVHRVDHRLYRNKIAALTRNWDDISGICARAYLEWKQGKRAARPATADAALPPLDLWDTGLSPARDAFFCIDVIGLSGLYMAAVFYGQLTQFRSLL
jgi:hypothetical protein